MEDAEVLNAFFAPVFINKISLQKSQARENGRKPGARLAAGGGSGYRILKEIEHTKIHGSSEGAPVNAERNT